MCGRRKVRFPRLFVACRQAEWRPSTSQLAFERTSRARQRICSFGRTGPSRTLNYQQAPETTRWCAWAQRAERRRTCGAAAPSWTAWWRKSQSSAAAFRRRSRRFWPRCPIPNGWPSLSSGTGLPARAAVQWPLLRARWPTSPSLARFARHFPEPRRQQLEQSRAPLGRSRTRQRADQRVNGSGSPQCPPACWPQLGHGGLMAVACRYARWRRRPGLMATWSHARRRLTSCLPVRPSPSSSAPCGLGQIRKPHSLSAYGIRPRGLRRQVLRAVPTGCSSRPPCRHRSPTRGGTPHTLAVTKRRSAASLRAPHRVARLRPAKLRCCHPAPLGWRRGLRRGSGASACARSTRMQAHCAGGNSTTRAQRRSAGQSGRPGRKPRHFGLFDRPRRPPAKLGREAPRRTLIPLGRGAL